jgi:tetratricopeptide (TPR) repeat protein
MFQRVAASLIVLLVCVATCRAHTAPADQCSVGVLKKDAAAALEACNAALARPGLDAGARAALLKIRGRALHKSDRLDEAIATYEEALRLAPGDAELHLRRGWTAFDRRDLETVFAQARRALEINPHYADPYDLLGAAFAVSGKDKIDEAKAAYEQAARLDPTQPLPLYHLYELFNLKCQCRRPLDALHAVEQILKLPAQAITEPGEVEVYRTPTTYRVAANIARGELLGMLGRPNEARAAYDQAIADDPNALTYAGRAQFRLSLPDSESAIQADLNSALALDPDFWLARYDQALVHFYAARYDAASAELVHTLKVYPKYGEGHWRYAQTLRKLGREDEALEQALTAFEVDPNFAFSKFGMLQKRGYLASLASLEKVADPGAALADAVRACMLDQECG